MYSCYVYESGIINKCSDCLLVIKQNRNLIFLTNVNLTLKKEKYIFSGISTFLSIEASPYIICKVVQHKCFKEFMSEYEQCTSRF